MHFSKVLLGLLFGAFSFSCATAQNVEKDSTEWVGEWRDEGNLQYAYRLKLKPAGEGRFTGVFQWRLIWTSLSEHKSKVGAWANEYVVGRYDATERSFNLVGIKQEDPADIISMDHYLIQVSEDGKKLDGINVKPENYHGTMFGVKLEVKPKPKPVVAAAKVDAVKPKPSPGPVAVKPAPKPSPTPAKPTPATSPAPVATSPVPVAHDVETREIVTKTQMRASESKVKIRVFDESMIDGDVISLSWNGIWVLRYYRIAKEPKELILDLAPGENRLVMYAENLGRYPPNTAAITVHRGAKVEQVILNSDMGKSESIQIIRE